MKNLKLLVIVVLIISMLMVGCTNTGDPAVSSNGNTNDNVGGDIPYESICFASDTIDEFIDWVKSDGQKDVGRNGSLEYPANKKFIDWAKNRDSLVIPIVKNDSFHIHAARIFRDEDAYNIVYTTYHPDMVNPQTAQTLSISCLSLDDEEQTNELQQIIYQSSYIEKDYIHINNLYKGATQSPWGDFYYTNYTGNENEDPDPFNGVFLQYKDFLVVISWNENFPVGNSYSELFNDLDFEEISLK